MLIRKIYAL